MTLASGKCGFPVRIGSGSLSGGSMSGCRSATAFCGSDVERELKSWAAREAEAIEAVLATSEYKAAGVAQAETDRRAALANETHQPFTVVAKSSNVGAFGHHQYVMVAADGSAWKVQRIYLYPWQTGQVVTVPLVNGEPDWCSIQGVECPNRDCPLHA